jgi:hypothetical protein
MTLFFNILNLEQEAGNDSKRFVKLLENLHFKKLPKNGRFRAPKLQLTGNSYLLNPEPLFYLKIDINYIVQYVKLAGRRDYGMYKHYESKSLQLSYFPDILLGNIKTNPLLKITKDEIFFKYEETKGN